VGGVPVREDPGRRYVRGGAEGPWWSRGTGTNRAAELSLVGRGFVRAWWPSGCAQHGKINPQWTFRTRPGGRRSPNRQTGRASVPTPMAARITRRTNAAPLSERASIVGGGGVEPSDGGGQARPGRSPLSITAMLPVHRGAAGGANGGRRRSRSRVEGAALLRPQHRPADPPATPTRAARACGCPRHRPDHRPDDRRPHESRGRMRWPGRRIPGAQTSQQQ
jgi:hypothetical protein